MESHLLQMRGLKLSTINNVASRSIVASFTDAWIETFLEVSALIFFVVASFTDAWIETLLRPVQYHLPRSRIFYRCVD